MNYPEVRTFPETKIIKHITASRYPSKQYIELHLVEGDLMLTFEKYVLVNKSVIDIEHAGFKLVKQFKDKKLYNSKYTIRLDHLSELEEWVIRMLNKVL